MSENVQVGRWRIMHARPSSDGGYRMLAALPTRAEMWTEWERLIKEMPNELLVFRIYAHDGSYEDRLPIDDTLDELAEMRRRAHGR